MSSTVLRWYSVGIGDDVLTFAPILARSRGAAKRQRWGALRDVDPDLAFTALRARVIGPAIGHWAITAEPPGFREAVDRRGIPWARIGMRVSGEGMVGTIVGMNSSGNLDVLFDHLNHVSNVHPWDDGVSYFDEAGRLIAVGKDVIAQEGAAL